MDANNLKRRVFQNLLRLKRRAKRYVGVLPRSKGMGQYKILFILGCQRSGTTLLTRIFEQDWRVRVFNEFDDLSTDDREAGIRLNALPKVHDVLSKQRVEYVVAKPIVESHRCRELLEFFTNSRVIWLYRHFADVAASDLKKFGLRNGIRNLRPIVNREPNNWRSEGVDESVWNLVSSHFAEEMNPYDAAALFWYCRNICVFPSGAGSGSLSSRIMLMPYELLVTNPKETMNEVYSFSGWRFPGRRIVAEVDNESVRRKRDIPLSPEVEGLCQRLLSRLDESARYQRTDYA